MERSRAKRLAAEFGVIVLGVLTALALESAWQSWQEATLEVEYLAALRQEGEANLRSLRRTVGAAESSLSSLEEVLVATGGGPLEGRERDIAASLQAATRTSHDIAVQRAVFADLQSTGNLRLIGDPELRRQVAQMYASLEGALYRMNANALRLNSGLYNVVAGYEGDYGLASSPGIPAEASDRVPEFLDEVVSDPLFRAELSRELRRHANAQLYLGSLVPMVEAYLSVLDEAGR